MLRELQNRIDEVDTLIGSRLHLRGPLGVKLEKGARRLPRPLRGRARELVQAQQLLRNPVMATKLDHGRLAETCRMLESHLKSVPEGKYRRRDWSAVIGAATWRVMLVVAGAVGVAWWQL